MSLACGRRAGVVTFVFGLLSFFDGATSHLPAWGWRSGALAAAVCAWPPQGARLRPAPLIALCSLLAAYGWGLMRSPQFGIGVQPLASLTMAAMVFVALRHKPPAIQSGVRDGLIAVGAAHAIWGLAQYAGLHIAAVSRVTGGFFSPIDLAAFLAPLALWSGFAAWQAQTPRQRLTYASLTAPMVLGLFLSRSRGGLLGALLGLGTALGLGIEPQTWRRIAQTPAGRTQLPLLAGCSAALVATSLWALRRRFSSAYDPEVYGRLQIWRSCAQLFATNPQGLGTGGVAAALRLAGVPSHGPVRFAHLAHDAHNTFLQTTLECGMLGAIGWAIFVGIFAAGLMRLPMAQRWQLGIGAALLLPALTATTWQQPPVALLIAVWAAQLWPKAACLAADSSPARQYPLGSRPLWAAVACVTSALLIPGALSHLCLLAAHNLGGQRQTVDSAGTVCRWAAQLAPWSCNTAMLAQQLANLQPAPPSTQAQIAQLMALAEVHRQSPEPLHRAAMGLAQLAKTPSQWTQVADVWQMAAERDPHNALFWLNAARAAAQSALPHSAQALFDRALAQEPHCAGAWLGLAEMAAAKHEIQTLQKALAQARHSLRLAPAQTGYARSVLSLEPKEHSRLEALRRQYGGPT